MNAEATDLDRVDAEATDLDSVAVFANYLKSLLISNHSASTASCIHSSLYPSAAFSL
jgi:hypothetical protein